MAPRVADDESEDEGLSQTPPPLQPQPQPQPQPPIVQQPGPSMLLHFFCFTLTTNKRNFISSSLRWFSNIPMSAVFL